MPTSRTNNARGWKDASITDSFESLIKSGACYETNPCQRRVPGSGSSSADDAVATGLWRGRTNSRHLSGRVTQSGVSDNFKMLVPVYLDMGKGWVRLGSATVIGNSSVDLKDIKLPAAPRRAAICALDDVLALSIQNSK